LDLDYVTYCIAIFLSCSWTW